MGRLIDADKLLEKQFFSLDDDGFGMMVVSVTDIISAPTVDAVEVVRCKDCKHYDNSEGICWCKLNSKFFPGGFDWHGFPEDGFCSYGERREVE